MQRYQRSTEAICDRTWGDLQQVPSQGSLRELEYAIGSEFDAVIFLAGFEVHRSHNVQSHLARVDRVSKATKCFF